MVDTCLVTGTIVAPDGTPVRRAFMLFQRLPEEAFVADDATALPTPVTKRTANDGSIEVELIPGAYLVKQWYGKHDYFRIDVPDEPTARLEDIQDDILQPPPSRIIEAVDAAKEARDEAVDAKGAAEEAAARAEAARAAARTIFPNIAAGLSATTDGDYFSVPSEDDDEYLILYRNDGGSATEVRRYPSAEAVDNALEYSEQITRVAVDLASEPGPVGGEFHGDNTPDVSYVLSADDGQSLAAFAGDGTIITQWQGEFHGDEDLPEYAITDDTGHIIFGWLKDGTFTHGGGGGGDYQDQIDELDLRVDNLQGDVGSLGISVQQAMDLAEALGQAQQYGFSVYGSVEDGLLDTDDGNYFAVSAPGDKAFQTLYRNDDGTAEYINRVPSLEHAPFTEAEVEPGQVYRDQGLVRVRRTYGPYWDINAVPNQQSNIFSTHAELHQRYEEVRAAHPEYITAEQIGQDGLGNPIMEYVATPPPFQESSNWPPWPAQDVAPPTIVCMAGTHGSERVTMLTLLQLIYDLAFEWDRHPRLEALRWGCKLVFVPTICPSGLDQNTRHNHNHVNLNRNGPWLWGTTGSSDPQSSDYRGPSALSELEAQTAMSLADRYPDAIAFIDFHNHSSPTGEGMTTWIGVDRPSELGVATRILTEAQIHLARDFPDFPVGQTPYMRLTQSIGGTASGSWSNTYDKPGYIHETPRWWNEIGSLGLMRHNMEVTVLSLWAMYEREMAKRLQSMGE